MKPAPFFTDLGRRLGDARQARHLEFERFFAGLAPQLTTAIHLERELDRHVARRFNVLDYLRTDELGLSRIIAELLDPGAAHGQAALFLQELLTPLKRAFATTQYPTLIFGYESRFFASPARYSNLA